MIDLNSMVGFRSRLLSYTHASAKHTRSKLTTLTNNDNNYLVSGKLPSHDLPTKLCLVKPVTMKRMNTSNHSPTCYNTTPDWQLVLYYTFQTPIHTNVPFNCNQKSNEQKKNNPKLTKKTCPPPAHNEQPTYIIFPAHTALLPPLSCPTVTRGGCVAGNHQFSMRTTKDIFRPASYISRRCATFQRDPTMIVSLRRSTQCAIR